MAGAGTGIRDAFLRRMVHSLVDTKRNGGADGVRTNYFNFDAEYVQSLENGVASVEHHFATYFGELLSRRLRRRLRSPQLVEDVRQETLMRVLRTIRTKGLLKD